MKISSLGLRFWRAFFAGVFVNDLVGSLTTVSIRFRFNRGDNTQNRVLPPP